MHALIKLFYDFRSWLSGSAVPKDDFVVLERDFVRKVAFPSFEWAKKSEPSPMNLPSKPLEQCRVALAATGGVYMKGQKPYKMGLSGDSSFRIIPGEVDFAALRVRHAGYNTRRIRDDLNCVFPLQRLRELVQEGLVGELAPRHLSFMGFAPKTEPLEERYAPEAARLLKEDQVDLTLLAPA